MPSRYAEVVLPLRAVDRCGSKGNTKDDPGEGFAAGRAHVGTRTTVVDAFLRSYLGDAHWLMFCIASLERCPPRLRPDPPPQFRLMLCAEIFSDFYLLRPTPESLSHCTVL